MGTPLAVGERVLGVLYADTVRSGRRLAQADLDLLAGFGNQAALALDRAAMQERLRGEALLRGRLEGFLPPSAADRFETGAVRLDVVEARVTALCCALGDAGARLSALAPRDAMALLAEYLPLVSSAVFGNGGTLVTSTGAGVLAIWGAPLARDDDADRAIAAARAAQRAAYGRSFALRIGLHTGPAVAGNVGTPRYPRYAALGEAVSVAERACAAAGGGEIVLSAQTAAALGGAPPALDPLPGGDAGGDAIALFRLRPGA
jgi:adenylate cyclase